MEDKKKIYKKLFLEVLPLILPIFLIILWIAFMLIGNERVQIWLSRSLEFLTIKDVLILLIIHAILTK